MKITQDSLPPRPVSESLIFNDEFKLGERDDLARCSNLFRDSNLLFPGAPFDSLHNQADSFFYSAGKPDSSAILSKLPTSDRIEGTASLLDPFSPALLPKKITVEPKSINLQVASRADTEDSTNFSSLKDLYRSLVFLFCRKSEDGHPEVSLSDVERQMLGLVLKRKAGQKYFCLTSLLNKNLNLEEIKKSLSDLKTKRAEESLKFIFSRAFKTLFGRFTLLGKSRKDSEYQFYVHYFGETAKQKGVPLEQFFNPVSLKSKSSKTNYNMKFFNNVFQSNKFLVDFLGYIKKNFIAEYNEEIKKKLEILLKKWDKPSVAQVDIKDAADYLTKNKKCKLPWTVDEVKYSILTFISLIKEINPDFEIKVEDYADLS